MAKKVTPRRVLSDLSSDESSDSDTFDSESQNVESQFAEQPPTDLELPSNSEDATRSHVEIREQSHGHHEQPLTLQEVHTSLSTLINNHMGALDQRVTALEKMMSSKKTAKTQNDNVQMKPIRKEVRHQYKILLDSEESNFLGYDFSPSAAFKLGRNADVTKRLIDDVRTSNPSYSREHINKAAYTYYKSLSKEQKAKNSGKYEDTVVTKRRRERFNRKISQRCAEFQKLSYAEVDRKKWEKVLTHDMISSDESDADDNGKAIFSVKELLWRNERVTSFFTKLDDSMEKRKSDQAVRQSKPRVRGNKVSNRDPPEHAPSWAKK